MCSAFHSGETARLRPPAVQIMGQLREGRRPDVPGQAQGAPAASLAAFVLLMQQCWAQESSSRPAMSAVAEQLEALCRELAPPAPLAQQSDGACPICLESWAELASAGVPQTILLPCAHQGTCRDCVGKAQALAAPRRARCPVCRAEVGMGWLQALVMEPSAVKNTKYIYMSATNLLLCCCACRWRATWTSPWSAPCEGVTS